MTGMLASVTNIIEAEIVMNAGVDIVDIKHPGEGVLGALKVTEVKDIVDYVNQTIPVSATIGDIQPNSSVLSKSIFDMANTGVDYVKVGLFDSQISEHFFKTIHEAAKDINLIIVLFAEDYTNLGPIEPVLYDSITGIMLDTKNKNGRNLCSILHDAQLLDFLKVAKEAHLLTGLAGSLQFSDIPHLLNLNPDYLGFRGALCSNNDRINKVDDIQVKKIRSVIPFTKSIKHHKCYDRSNYLEV